MKRDEKNIKDIISKCIADYCQNNRFTSGQDYFCGYGREISAHCPFGDESLVVLKGEYSYHRCEFKEEDYK
jgi:hypothetical protein